MRLSPPPPPHHTPIELAPHFKIGSAVPDFLGGEESAVNVTVTYEHGNRIRQQIKDLSCREWKKSGLPL